MSTETSDQAPPQSLEDRLAAQFGLSDDAPLRETFDGKRIEAQTEEEVPEVKAEAEEDVEVEYEGERYRLPKKLEKAVMQERDYTQKSQELADQRRQVEHAHKALETARMEKDYQHSVEGEVQQIQMLDNYLAQLKQTNVQDLPMEEGFRHWMQLTQLKEQREALHKSVTDKRSEFDSKAKQAIETLKSQAKELLAKQLPGYDAAEIATHAKTLGYTEQDVEMMQVDPRAVSVLYKAMKYDQLQANKSAAVQKVVSPGVKPGSSNPMPQQVKDTFAYNKAMKAATTSQEKAKIIQRRLENSF